MNLTQNQIEALMDEKGNPKKCPECYGNGAIDLLRDFENKKKIKCLICQGTGQSSIEIEKEWVECTELCDCGHRIDRHKLGGCQVVHREGDDDVDCDCETTFGKIQKYNVGQEIIPELCGNRQLSKTGFCMDCGEHHKLKIISETEIMQRLIMVR